MPSALRRCKVQVRHENVTMMKRVIEIPRSARRIGPSASEQGIAKGGYMRYQIEVGGPVQLFARTLPADSVPVGIIRLANGETGALIRFRGSGEYARLNSDRLRPLSKREVIRALQEGQHALRVIKR
jgi:hypothetical protein